MYSALVQVSLATLAILLIKLCYSAWHRRNYWPPGPPGVPIFGNIFQVPPSQPWFQFSKWKEVYGPIFSLNIAGKPAIVINSHEIAVDLFNRRADIYADRPEFIVTKMLTGGLFFALANGKQWMKMRRLGQDFVRVHIVNSGQLQQEEHATRLVLSMLHNPEDWYQNIKRSFNSSVTSLVYGLRLSNDKTNDDIINRWDAFVSHIFKAALPGTHLVEFIPVLNIFPAWMAQWKCKALQWHIKDTKMLEELLEDVDERMRSGDSIPCFSSVLLENKEKYNLTNKEIAWAAGTLIAGGMATTSAAMHYFVLAMCLYPHAMRKAQAEIDRVVGRYRLPKLADSNSLPYIRAMVKELLRWRPIGPAGVARSATVDDWYNGYFIPKGSIVVYNVWDMNRDQKIYPDFEEFRPERFLDDTETIDTVPPNTLSLGHVSYGFGKRICLGMNFANQDLFIKIACLLWAFNIEKVKNENGELEIPSRTEIIDEGISTRPVPFKCSISARSPNVFAVLENSD